MHGALEVRIPFGAGGSRAEVEQVVLDPRRVAEVTVDVTGAASADQIDRAIAQALRTAGVGAQDLATVHVTGRLATGVRWSGPGTELRATVLHLWADAKGLRASHDLDRYRTSTGMTTEERFARELIARLDATQDPRERERLEYALTLGLDAFHSGAIAPMWTGGES